MEIDISRVNLLEKDIEDWLYVSPIQFGKGFTGEPIIDRWIARQYKLPSGIADLVGLTSEGALAVVEVKNVPINKAAVLQVCRYAQDLSYIVGNRDDYFRKGSDNPYRVDKILCGPSIDEQTLIEAQACGVEVFEFNVAMLMHITRREQSMDDYKKTAEQIDEISRRHEWDIFGKHFSDHASEQRDQYDELLDAINDEANRNG